MMLIVWLVLPLLDPKLSICFTMSMPAVTEPKTTCFPSSQGQGTVVMKNWEREDNEFTCVRMILSWIT